MMLCMYSSELELRNVYQSRHSLQFVTFAADALIAIIDSTKAIRVPLLQIELLASKSIPQLAALQKTNPDVVLIQQPALLDRFQPVDILLCSASRIVVPFNDGSIWDVDFKDPDNQHLVGVKYA